MVRPFLSMLLQLGLCGALILGAAGCARSDPADALLGDYVARVERTLDGAVGDPVAVVVPPWPRARDRQLPTPEVRIDVVDFLRLQACGLGDLVGERASSLGRLQGAPERLRQERALVAALPGCLERAGDDPALRDVVAAIREGKAVVLGAVVWNATLGSDVLGRQHAVGVPALAPEEVSAAGREALGALYALVDRAEGRLPAQAQGWLAPWKTLDGAPVGGRLHRSLVTLDAHLARASARLQGAGTVCVDGFASPTGVIMGNIFERHYVARVQPYLAAVEGLARDWTDALAALRAAQAVEVPAALAVDPLTRSFQRLSVTRATHTRLWQELLGACGLAPVAPARAVREAPSGAP